MNNKIKITYVPMGDQILVLQFEDVLSIDNNQMVQSCASMIRQENINGVSSVITTMASIAVKYDSLIIQFNPLKKMLQKLLLVHKEQAKIENKTITVPVVFNERFGLDLEEVSQTKDISKDDIINMITAKKYYVYMVGFIHGVPYMGNVDKRLELLRKSNPRLKVPKGSIGIANDMTNIYTLESPGGWHIIGWTPMEVFDVKKNPPNLLSAGDYVRYENISEEVAENWDKIKQKEWDQQWNT
ncbi:5-oxoprolinase subunit PxpB [Paenisporosarcina sp. TG20]|uniref:5-oxoprolinase subunit PxpB n=1 Tax=Paenisporosarcina sp. TG20 TaxID=1211706 RepID=UPI0002E18334|nr:5-oxoprolinase subunit PxpB [Paenisporosarcina sp. TG20]